MAKKRLLSGIQPSGKLHIGNYFGALKQFVDLQEEYENFIFVANFHSLTTITNANELRANTIEVVKDYLAAGLDPKQTVLYTQTEVSEVTELAWIFSTIVTVPFLETPQYKDKLSRDTEIFPNVGLLTYPILQAADILIVDADVVPVGKDQEHHVEMAREIARKFNNAFGETFKLPKSLNPEEVAVVPGIDGQKMGKSEGNTIPLFGSDDEIRAQVAKIKTDSKTPEEPKDPEEDLVFAFHKLFSKDQLSEIEKRYKDGGMGHKESKDILAENIIKMIKPMREKRESISDEDVMKVLEDGAQKVRVVAGAKLKEVREKAGLI